VLDLLESRYGAGDVAFDPDEVDVEAFIADRSGLNTLVPVISAGRPG
jgi:hypothetical protein